MAHEVDEEIKINVELPDNTIHNITPEKWYDQERYDTSTMALDDLFKMLDVTRDGLTSKQARIRLQKFGHNQQRWKKKRSRFQFLRFLWNPFSWIMEVAAIVAIVIANGGGQAPDWEVCVGILLLLFINLLIGFIAWRTSKNLMKASYKTFEMKVKVKRDGKWTIIDEGGLVPGDIISIKQDSNIHADARIFATRRECFVDQSAWTGESLPVRKLIGDVVFCGTTCIQGEGEAIVTKTGNHTYCAGACSLPGKHGYELSPLQTIVTTTNFLCAVFVFITIITETIVMYAFSHYKYRRGINNILALLIGGSPIAMLTILVVMLAVGVKKLSKNKIFILDMWTIEKLAAVNILCVDKIGILTLNRPVIDKSIIKQYSDVGPDCILNYAAIASRLQNQNVIDIYETVTDDDKRQIEEHIENLTFKASYWTDTRKEITFKQRTDGKVYRVTMGMAQVILDLCTREKTDELISQFNNDVDQFARQGLQPWGVAIDEVPSRTVDGNGIGFRLLGLFPIHYPLLSDTKEMIKQSVELGVKVQMLTDDPLDIAKANGRHLRIGDNILSCKIFNDDLPTESGDHDMDDRIFHADGFVNVDDDEKNYTMVDRLQRMGYIVAVTGNDYRLTSILTTADIAILGPKLSDNTFSFPDVILIKSNLSFIIKAIRISKQIVQRMRTYIIHTYSGIVHMLITFPILVFAFKFDFPSFMILILIFLNYGTMVSIAKDRVKPLLYPHSWNLSEISTFAAAYGIYLSISTIVFFILITKSTFFYDKFGVEQLSIQNTTDMSDAKMHSIIYLQVSIISQALIFVTRSGGFFFTERPSLILIAAFATAQLFATFIAVYANWSFTDIQGCGWAWAKIVWIWNIIWLFPLDLIKFALRMYFHSRKKLVSEETMSSESLIKQRRTDRAAIIKGHRPRIQEYILFRMLRRFGFDFLNIGIIDEQYGSVTLEQIYGTSTLLNDVDDMFVDA